LKDQLEGYSKKKITGGKSEMTYITGGKTLLTLFLSLVPDVILPPTKKQNYDKQKYDQRIKKNLSESLDWRKSTSLKV